jgi:hypothetical protein
VPEIPLIVGTAPQSADVNINETMNAMNASMTPDTLSANSFPPTSVISSSGDKASEFMCRMTSCTQIRGVYVQSRSNGKLFVSSDLSLSGDEMEFKVKWVNLDQESRGKERSRAKSSVLSLGTSGNKRVQSPSRGIKISQGVSDFELWNKVTKNILPPEGLALMHRMVQKETLRNISQTNGEFNRLVSSASAALKEVDDRSIRAIYPRIPQTESNRVRMTATNVKAFLDFLNLADGNDANILPLPPTKTLISRLPEIKKGVDEVYETESKSKSKPLFGYIPALENPNQAEAIVNMYLNLEVAVNAFIIDFNNGRRDRTANVVIRRLIQANKTEGLGDYYVHAVDVPKNVSSRAMATPFYDLPLVVEGIDSFHNLLFGGGSSQKPKKGQSVVDVNKGKKYAVQSQYGSYTFEGLRKRGLLNETCHCKACQGRSLEEMFCTPDTRTFRDTLTVHRIFVNLEETEEQKRTMNERRSLLDYLRQKPMAKSQIADLMTMIKGLD